ncbi:hypothetical protein L596_023990 [Steinernema carpocapsae]|uniref:Uncharacterized protein n=1 Tax=Steinernema carpocapsae TaxID=34508 RepID=A0A4U5MFB8_STECR|nr:hypothetical protein L596_023990 [Steinernema carpocapsae]
MLQEDHPSTLQGEARKSNIRTVTPSYKSDYSKSTSDLKIGSNVNLPSTNGDYSVKETQDHYKLQIIDPKVRSNANMPVSSTSIEHRRQLVSDFPSEHSKRSFLKLAPMEQRRFKSVESRPITTSTYLTESVDRHRDMEASRLKDYLREKEGDANKPWNKPNLPTKDNKENQESLRELEQIRHTIETLQKQISTRSQSMRDLHIVTPEEFAKDHPPPDPEASPRDTGWLVKRRKNRYLDVVNEANKPPKRTRSVGDLSAGRSRKFSVGSATSNWKPISESGRSTPTTFPADRVARADSEEKPADQNSIIDVSKLDEAGRVVEERFYVEHRGSFTRHQTRETHRSSSSVQQFSSSSSSAPPPLPSSQPPPLSSLQTSVTSQPSQPPQLVSVNISSSGPPSEAPTVADTSAASRRPPGDDYSDRLMSPVPTKSILKQTFSSQQRATDQNSYWEQDQKVSSTENGHFEAPSRSQNTTAEMEHQSQIHKEASLFDVMQENLRRHRLQRSHTPNMHQKYPTTSFNGPFFKLEEVPKGMNGHHHQQDKPRSQSVAPRLSVTEPSDEHLNYSGHHHSSTSSYHQEEKSFEESAKWNSECELNGHNGDVNENGVVIWPPPSGKHRVRPASAMARSVMDPDRIDEYQRQKKLEEEAIRRRELQYREKMERQHYAVMMQQAKQEQQFQEMQIRSRNIAEQRGIPEQPEEGQFYPQQARDPAPQMQMPEISDRALQGANPEIRVFETRPISSMSSEWQDPGNDSYFQSPMPTWKRTYLLNEGRNMAKNEILTSEEILEKEQYNVDYMNRRAAFIPKPDRMPNIQRTGKRWQPPTDKPYVWPTYNPPPMPMSPTLFSPPPPEEDQEHLWRPVVIDPEFKKERKNFTPHNSPPQSPRKGRGTVPLDDVARRQTKHVIQPSPDGSHRPKPAFRKSRSTPSGGFYPHAPNAVKIVKKRSSQVQGSANSPFDVVDSEQRDVEVIHQRNYHSVDDNRRRHAKSVDPERSQNYHHQALNDWEKIYDLPPHSSTLVAKEHHSNVDVRRRLQQLQQLEAQRIERSLQKRQSEMHQSHSHSHHRQGSSSSKSGTLLRRVNDVSEGDILTRQSSHSSMAGSTSQRREHRSQSEYKTQKRLTRLAQATAVPPTPVSYNRARAFVPPPLPPGVRMPPQGMHSPRSPPAVGPPGNTKRLIKAVKSASSNFQYNSIPNPHQVPPTVIQFRPPAAGSSSFTGPLEHSSSPSRHPPSFLPNLPTSAADEGPRKDDELDDLARRNRELLERSKGRQNDFRLVGSDVYKQEPELPQQLKDQIREMLESRISDTTQSTFQNDRSGYVTDVSSATWQFNTSNSFSPRSVVSMNGSSPLKVDTSNLSKTLSRSNAAVQTIEKETSKQPWPYMPADLGSVADSSQSTMTREYSENFARRVERFNSMPALDRAGDSRGTLIKIKDERPRSIMKRRELESKERMMYAEPPREVANRGGWETTTRVIRPGVTETVQRFEETKRTEEVERRVQRKERREKKHRSGHRRQEAVEWHGGQGGQYRSSSMGRGYSNGYGHLPSYESYQHSTTTRRPREQREQELERHAESQQFQRFGSNVSNSLRRGDMKYNPNGDVSHNGRVHKSYSTRDVFHDGGRDFDDYSRSQQYSSHHRRNSYSNQPLVEFPPTLPRDSGIPPMPPPHRGGGGRVSDFYRPISKARSYADWDSSMRRYDDDMSRLENEFRDSLLMPLPKQQGNMHEKDYRTEQIPGGYETMNRETKSNAGRRLNREGVPSNFHEASQEYSYKRETETDRPY